MPAIPQRTAYTRTTTPFDGGLSPLTDKSRGVPLFGNTPLIQDLIEGNREGFNDIHGRGSWAAEPDQQGSFRETGDQYKTDEAMRVLDMERARGRRRNQRLVAEMEDGTRYEFPDKQTALFQLRLLGKPFRRLFRRLAADTSVVSDVIDGCVGVKSDGPSCGGVGAAFCVAEGKYVTCAHVVMPYEIGSDVDASGFASGVEIELSRGGESAPARLVGVSTSKDVALLECGMRSRVLRLSPSGSHEQGEPVLVVGSPKGFENEVSEGIIGGLDRIVFLHEGAPRHVFTDAKILPGNSGGPMVSLRDGTVIGMIEIIVGDKSTYGLNAAIEAENVLEALQEIGFAMPKE